MPSKGRARLANALEQELLAALTASSNRWVRIEFPREWPINQILSRAKNQLGRLRIGVLRPFAKSDFTGLDAKVSSSASEITGWRNRLSKETDTTTLLFGDARGSEEAGLKSAPQVLTDAAVLVRWRGEARAWFKDNVHSQTPLPLLNELFDQALAGDVDAMDLDDYIGSAATDPDHSLASLRAGLWRLGLIPDNRVLDSGQAATRLRLNAQTVQLLTSASDTPGDLNRLQRLRSASEGGNQHARKAEQFRTTGEKSALKGIELDELLSILSPSSKREPGPARPLTLTEFLNSAATNSPDVNRETLRLLAEAWDLSSIDPVDVVVPFSRPNATAAEVHVTATPMPTEGTPWTGDGSPAQQVVAFIADPDARRDWLPNAPQGLTGEALLSAARAQDVMLSPARFEAACNDYLSARARLTVYERWLRDSALELLLLKEQARTDLHAFLDAWSALLAVANDLPSGEADVMRRVLVLLEALWGRKGLADEKLAWCVLGPLHPYVLDPLVRLAEYALTNMGVAELGDKISWALSRSVPAYRAVWTTDTTLFLAGADEIFEYEIAPSGFHPAALGGDGLYQIAKAFLGFHPFANETLVITLIDPPKGGAVPQNLRRLEREVANLRVYLVTISGDGSQLEESGEVVRNLGRFTNLDDWLSRAGVRSHLVFYFAKRPPGSVVAAQKGWGPTPGSHVALKIRLDTTSPFQDAQRLSPFVTFEPRESNSAVVALQRLAAPSMGAPRLFELEPMLRESETAQFARLEEIADWAVIAAPSPLGLIAPRNIGSQLIYLGRESLDTYGLFVYTSDLFAIRKVVTQQLRPLPVMPEPKKVEDRLTELAVHSPDGVLRIGRSHGGALWEQLGNIASSKFGMIPKE